MEKQTNEIPLMNNRPEASEQGGEEDDLGEVAGDQRDPTIVAAK